ncbi:sigma-70 family RNA polymerase sigma factor [Bremerella sp. P1]|uniref:sigma-70 family RNA polymerase sigma factor n=1 Tax=Bremerella sp. P1 TaxID=3026424 RepID=UPI002367FE05|nr:sigma-70 family RNA polymerase sigma factor [Bremerella sp. P1]WDI39954.1 sigma-70 family RNA polymerase sigma factor [Bremerella sp. P1]
MAESPPSHRDPTPFVELIVKFERPLMRYIRSSVPRLDDAEEVWQATAIVLWEKFEEFDHEREFLPWAQKFAYFESLKQRRKIARDRMVFSESAMQAIADTHQSSQEHLDRRSRALKICMDSLGSKDLALLRSRYDSEITIGELAGQMETTAKTLYRRLDRIRDKLAQCVRRRVALAEE